MYIFSTAFFLLLILPLNIIAARKKSLRNRLDIILIGLEFAFPFPFLWTFSFAEGLPAESKINAVCLLLVAVPLLVAFFCLGVRLYEKRKNAKAPPPAD